MFLKNRHKVGALTVIVLIILTAAFGIKFLRFKHADGINMPIARNGLLDLANWDFGEKGNVRLDGTWEFYWNQLLTPDDFVSGKPKLTGYIQVPSIWKGNIGKESLSHNGIGTYRLKIKVSDPSLTYGLKSTFIRISSAIYVNGRLIGKGGNPARNIKAGYISGNVPIIASFPGKNGYIEIIVQVANLDYYRAGGIFQSIYLGREKDILDMNSIALAFSMFIISCLLITGLYFTCVFLGIRKDRSILYFGLYCILFAYVQLTQGERILMQFFHYLSYQDLYQLKLMAIDGSVVALTLFVKEKGRSFMPEWLLRSVLVAFCLHAAMILTLPFIIQSRFEDDFLVFDILVYIVIIFNVSGAIIKKNYGNLNRNGAFLLLTGFILIVSYFINGVLYSISVTHDVTSGSILILLFPFLISLILAQQYVEAYQAIETVSLKFLQAQIKPHFIFNALSVISSLSIREPAKAKALILDLSDYLRGSFDVEHSGGLTTLQHEMELVRAYLSIEQARFKERLDVEFSIQEGLDCAIPMLSIQPLVENAVRHGIMPLIQGGKVSVTVREEGNFVAISVSDNGVGIDETEVKALLKGDPNQRGVGIRNIHRRLVAFYGRGLTVVRGVTSGTTVEFLIPRGRRTFEG